MSIEKLKGAISRLLALTPLAYFPVSVRRGPAKGAKWTLLPFSSNWRRGGDDDILVGLNLLIPAAGKVCWDLGAHFGIYTVAMAKLVGPTGQVVAFEPDAIACERLRHHVRINALANVRVVTAAASDACGKGELIVTQGLGSSFSHFRYEDEPVPASAHVQAADLVIADEMVARGECRAPDLIKVDVQGHGAQALRGSIGSIRARKPIIIFSNHSPWEYRGVRDLLEPMGYVPRATNLESISWDEVSNWDTVVFSIRAGD